MFSLDKKLWQWIALIFLAFIWGGSFILMKRGLDAFSYVQVASMRIFFSFVILLPLSIKHLKVFTRENFVPILICGVVGNLLPAYLFTLSETELSSSLAGILNALTPFFTVLIGVILFKNKPGKLQYLGVVIGFLGAAILVTNGNFNSFGDVNLYALFVVLATFFYGINVNVVRFRLSKLSGTQITALMFFLTGPMAGVVMLFTDMSAPFQSPDVWSSLLATFILAAFGSVVSMFVFNNLIHHTGAIFASSVTYIIPFFALMWGLLDNEYISIVHVYSMLIILAGVYLSSLKKKPSFGFLKR